jgi:hypothetical protein
MIVISTFKCVSFYGRGFKEMIIKQKESENNLNGNLSENHNNKAYFNTSEL